MMNKRILGIVLVMALFIMGSPVKVMSNCQLCLRVFMSYALSTAIGVSVDG